MTENIHDGNYLKLINYPVSAIVQHGAEFIHDFERFNMFNLRFNKEHPENYRRLVKKNEVSMFKPIRDIVRMLCNS